jgi:predicted amidohydrolase
MSRDLRKVCVAQIAITPGTVEENLAKITSVIERHDKNDLIVFPELIVHGHVYSTLPRDDIAEIISQTPSLDRVQEVARKHNVRVVLGSMEEREGRYLNVAVYLGTSHIETYAKTHVHWTEQFDPGTELKTFGSSFERIGPLICYDAAFPEAARTLTLQGARILTVLGAVPKTFHPHVMARRMQALAVMNQVFVVYANRGGESFNGGSGIWDPQGDVVGRVGTGEHILEAQIDLNEIDRWREEEPLYPHRRNDLYTVLSDPAHARPVEAPPAGEAPPGPGESPGTTP